VGLTQPPIQWVVVAKRPEPEVDHSPPSSGEVTNEWSCTFAPPVCLHCVDRDNCTFTFVSNAPGRCELLSSAFLSLYIYIHVCIYNLPHDVQELTSETLINYDIFTYFKREPEVLQHAW
jgi:hypothetical protein